MANPRKRVDLLSVAEILHRHLSQALCDAVWEETRKAERRRELDLALLGSFWTEVVLRAPPSLTQALQEAQQMGGEVGKPGYPRIRTSRQAFFSRCQELRPDFFERLFEAFRAQLEAAEPAEFARKHAAVAERFGGHLVVVDGSALDKVARRLKVLWHDPRVPMPGTLIALYDLRRGRLMHLEHTRELQSQESPRARRMLGRLEAGSLVTGDRLYGRPNMLREAVRRGLDFLARRHKRAKFRPQKLLQVTQTKSGRVEEWIGTLGVDPEAEARPVRLLRLKGKGRTLELVTTVLDPERLSAQEALDLYRGRWKIERLFHELKRVLNLHRFYAGNFAAISMQVFAAAIVHLALRAGQARIARQVDVEPETLSVQKLFPRLAAASILLNQSERTFQAIQRANPGVHLQKPDWSKMAFAWVYLDQILVEPRRGRRRKKRLRPDGQDLRRLPAPRRKKRR